MTVEELVHATLQQRELDVEELRLAREAQSATEDGSGVRILTNAARVLATVTRDPGATMRHIARQCGQTERAVWVQLNQLERAGLLTRHKVGRRNHYRVDAGALQRQLSAEGLSAAQA